MRLKAYITIENSVIVPFFAFVTIFLCGMCCYIHDRIVVRATLDSAAIMLEMKPEDKKNASKQELAQRANETIESKSLFLKNSKVSVSETSEQYAFNMEGTYSIASILHIGRSIKMSVSIEKNDPAKVIRVVNAFFKLLNRKRGVT